MADVSDLGGGGGLGQVCIPTNSDLAGAIDNLLARIEFLEKQLAIMLGENVEAGQLSDISQQVGWVHGITYAGIEGWTRTEAGTLIPPAGFSLADSGFLMSDGNRYPAVVMDENGVLHWGVTENGEVKGTDTGNSIAILYAPDPMPSAQVGNLTIINFPINLAYNTDGLVSKFGANKFKVNVTGLYNLSITASMSAAGNDDLANIFVRWSVDSGNINPLYPDTYDNFGPMLMFTPGNTGGAFIAAEALCASKLMYLKKGIGQGLSIISGGVTTSWNVGMITVTLQLVKSL